MEPKHAPAELATWRSLLVPSVQELAKKPIITVPPRYIRTDQDQLVISDAAKLPEVPVIDMQKLFSQESVDSELERLHFACKELGFFQMVNHGVSSSLLEKIKVEMQDFFNLPVEEKEKFWQTSGDIEGFGQAHVLSEDQRLDWGDLFYITTLPIHLRKPHLFPRLPLPLRDTLEIYSLEMKNLAMFILAKMAKALKMEGSEIKELFEEGRQSIRMNYYPPCPQPEQVIGITPHSDATGLTVLLQVNEVEGLEIRKDGMWVPVRPLPNAFIVNVGDIMEIVTNGAYRSIEHRVTVNSAKERLSVAAFYSPRLDGELGPAPSLIPPEKPALFRRVGVQEYFKTLFSRKIHGKSYLEAMRLQN